MSAPGGHTINVNTSGMGVEELAQAVAAQLQRSAAAADPPPAEGKALAPAASGGAADSMIALYPDAAQAAALARDGGSPPGDLHVTVVYTGKAADVDEDTLLAAARQVAAGRAPIVGEVSGLARFDGTKSAGPGDLLAALYDSPDLELLRRDVLEALGDAGVQPTLAHGYTPHMTLGSLEEGKALPLPHQDAQPVTFAALTVVHGATRHVLPFTGPQQEGKAFAGGKAPPFGAGGPGKTTGDGKNTGNSATGDTITSGAFVSVGNVKGRVDLVVTNGVVPGATGSDDKPVTGSDSSPAARVVVYDSAGAGAWKASGKKIAAKVSALHRVPPLRTAKGKSAAETIATMLVEYDEHTDAPLPGAAAVRQVYERGTGAWPGEDKTLLTRQEWGLCRVQAFLDTAVGYRPDGYRRDDDLLPQ